MQSNENNVWSYLQTTARVLVASLVFRLTELTSPPWVMIIRRNFRNMNHRQVGGRSSPHFEQAGSCLLPLSTGMKGKREKVNNNNRCEHLFGLQMKGFRS